jgi:hypothetical protein
MIELKDMQLPSGRSLGFERVGGKYICYLYSRYGNVLEYGTGACRLEALDDCARKVWERSYRQESLSHERYQQRVWFELQELVASCAATIPPTPPPDNWGRG